MMEENDTFKVLINLIKNEKIIYNSLLSKGISVDILKNLRDEAWERISRHINMPVTTCRAMWFKLKEEYVNAMTNRKRLKIDGNGENLIDNFKYREEMDFLSHHIAHTSSFHKETSSISVNGQTTSEVVNTPSSDPLKESMDCNKNSADILDDDDDDDIEIFEIKSNISLSSTENEFSDGTDGELIMDLGDELIRIPAQIINKEDEHKCIKDDIIVNITPKSKLFNNINNEDGYIPVELDMQGDNDPRVKIPYNQIFDLLNLNEELNLQIDDESNGKSNLDDEIELIPKKLNDDMNEEDPTSEEFFYKTLALTANSIDNFKERLELRQKVSKCVMEAVRKYYLEKEKTDDR